MPARPPRVVIVGGGPAGAATAIALAGHAIPALVLERAAGPQRKPGECLSPGFKQLLGRLGLSRLLDSGAHRRFPGITSVWERAEPVARDLLFEADGEGWLLDRTAFEAQLLEAARARGAIVRRGYRVEGVARAGAGFRVTAAGERGAVEIAADLLVDATGRAAAIARTLGSRVRRLDGLVGTWGLLEPVGGDRATSAEGGPIHIEATREGWWYAARLSGGHLSVVRFADRALLDPDEVMAALRGTRHASALLGERAFRLARPPTIHPASSARLTAPSGPGWFAVGDAAAAFDPLSSYGIGSALGTGFYAAQAIASAWAGDEAACDAYQALIERRYQVYLDALRERYRAVTRWPGAPFWRRRGGTAPGSGSG